MRRPHFIAVLLIAAACEPVLADEWNPWPNQRVVSKNGEFYVVIKRIAGRKFYGEWGPVEFTIARKRPGSPLVRPATAQVVELHVDDSLRGGFLYEVRNDADVSVRSGDTVLGWGMIDRPPLALHVSSNGRGFVGLDVWGYNYAFGHDQRKVHPAVVVFDVKGAVVRRVLLGDLFNDKELDLFYTTAGGTGWLGHSWIRDGKDELAILTMRSDESPEVQLVRFIDLVTGKVRHRTSLIDNPD